MKRLRHGQHSAFVAKARRLIGLLFLLTILSAVEAESMRNSQQDQETTCLGSIEKCMSHQEHAHHKPRRRSATPSKSSAAPAFGQPIGNVSVVAGRDVRLVCTVDNLGQHQVAWLKEETKTILSIDTNIITTNYRIFLIPDEEARKWVLHIKDVQESDRGFYRCQVNTNPMISTLGYLEVVVPPKIIEPDTTQTAHAVEHGNVSLQCKASGHPRPTISWRREDGEPIRLAGSGAGQAFRAADKERRVSPNSTSSLLDGGLESPSDAEIRKRAAGDSHPATFSQLNDVRTDKLTLTNVDRTMAGLYVCSASNGIPSQVSHQIPLYVKFPPKVTIAQRPSVSVALGEQLELECLIEAFPKPSSYWSGREAAPVSSRLSQVRFPAPPGGAASATRPRWLHESSAAWQRQNKPDHRMQLFVAAPLSNNARVLREHNLDSKGHEMLSLELGKGDNELEDHVEGHKSVQMADEQGLGLKHLARESTDAMVTVKQTPVNAHTYKLKLSVAQVRASDLGEYICVSSNSMGSSSARIQVRGKREPHLAAETAASSSAAFLSNDEREAEYQRDSLGGEPSGSLASSRLWANQLIQGTSPRGSLSGEQVRKPALVRPNRVYDENYLQAIRTRQGSNSQTLAGKLQTRPKSLPNSAAAASRHQTAQTFLWPFVALFFVATLTRGPLTHMTTE